MPDKLKYTLQSKKFWAFITAFVGLAFASYQNDGVITVAEIEKLVYLVIGYIGSVAIEDGLSNMNASQPPTVGIEANKVEVTPAQPTITHTGLN